MAHLIAQPWIPISSPLTPWFISHSGWCQRIHQSEPDTIASAAQGVIYRNNATHIKVKNLTNILQEKSLTENGHTGVISNHA